MSTLDPLEPGLMVGEYEITGRLGEGGMGVVYSAVHPVIGKRAAVKVLKKGLAASPEAIERFVQEARAVNQIGHPNIVDVFAFGELPDGRSYLAMEELRGESLATRMKRAPMSLSELTLIVNQVCRALEAAHAAGIVHRDLKPDNVYLCEVRDSEALVKLLDFGIAKLHGADGSPSELTRSGVLLGTPLYMSPEQARGRDVDARADIYSLGAMVFELLSGRPPFHKGSSMEVIAAHLDKAPPTLRSQSRDAPIVLDEIVGRMLSKEASGRPTLEEVRRVLAGLRERKPAPARPRRAIGWAAASLTLAAAAGIAAFLALKEEPAPVATAAITPLPPPAPDAAVAPPDAAAALPLAPPPARPPRKRKPDRPAIESLDDKPKDPFSR